MTFRHAEMGSKEKVLSNVYATQNLPQIGREEGIGMDGLIEDFGIDKRMCVRKLGKKEKGKLFKWDKRVKIVEELKVLQKGYMKPGGKMLVKHTGALQRW